MWRTPAPGELELFFRMEAAAVEHARAECRPHNWLGWMVWWGTACQQHTTVAALREPTGPS